AGPSRARASEGGEAFSMIGGRDRGGAGAGFPLGLWGTRSRRLSVRGRGAYPTGPRPGRPGHVPGGLDGPMRIRTSPTALALLLAAALAAPGCKSGGRARAMGPAGTTGDFSINRGDWLMGEQVAIWKVMSQPRTGAP